ncbi:hypothetical protein L1887_16320 [Cichorium endivia]|nr:hypothetical protein L1887_16320 [Cichorium endivia]
MESGDRVSVHFFPILRNSGAVVDAILLKLGHVTRVLIANWIVEHEDDVGIDHMPLPPKPSLTPKERKEKELRFWFA